MQENNHFGLFWTKQNHRNTERKKKTKPPKPQKWPNKTPFCMLANHPLFLFFIKLHYLMSAKLCFAENTIKIMFSAEHSFLESQIVKPLSGPLPKMALLQPKCHSGFYPCACWSPNFYSVLPLGMTTKKDHFPKTDSCNENAFFFTFRTQIVFAYFSKKWQFYKKKTFSSRPPKNTIFLGFVLNFSFFQFFHIILFPFSNIKRTTKIKVHIFFENPFLPPWQTVKKCSHPYTLFVILNIPKKYYKTGEKTSKKNLGPSFDPTLDQVLTQKNPKSWTKFWLYSIYVYIYIYTHTWWDFQPRKKKKKLVHHPPNSPPTPSRPLASAPLLLGDPPPRWDFH